MDDKSILLDKQQRVFRIACDPKRYGLTLKLISMDSGLHYDSVRHYAAGETALPLSAFVALMGIIPDELLSLLLPDGRKIVQVPEEINHDDIVAWSHKFQARKLEAHREDSPMGPAIAPCEDNDLKGIVVAFPGSVAA